MAILAYEKSQLGITTNYSPISDNAILAKLPDDRIVWVDNVDALIGHLLAQDPNLIGEGWTRYYRNGGQVVVSDTPTYTERPIEELFEEARRQGKIAINPNQGRDIANGKHGTIKEISYNYYVVRRHYTLYCCGSHILSYCPKKANDYLHRPNKKLLAAAKRGEIPWVILQGLLFGYTAAIYNAKLGIIAVTDTMDRRNAYGLILKRAKAAKLLKIKPTDGIKKLMRECKHAVPCILALKEFPIVLTKSEIRFENTAPLSDDLKTKYLRERQEFAQWIAKATRMKI